jgi:hypothetical protein
MKCEGNACSSVEILWDSSVSAYRLKNKGNHHVLVTLTGSSGETQILVKPNSNTVIYISQFDLPYRADLWDKAVKLV